MDLVQKGLFWYIIAHMNKSMEKAGQAVSMAVMLGLIVFFIGFMVWGVGEIFSSAKSRSERAEVVKPVVQPMEIVVSSQTVKSVGGKYRYFFDIRNQDDQAFSGSVKIELLGKDGRTVYNDTFTTNQPIQPGVGTSQFVEANTGLVSVHGEYGVASFRYTATSNGSVVKTGEGAISTKLEAY